MRPLACLIVAAALGCGPTHPGADSSVVARVCRAVGALACDQTEAECLDELGPKHTRKSKMGCGAESEAQLECSLSKPLTCASTSRGPATVSTANCKAEEAALLACLPSCGSSVTPTGVSYGCSGGKVGTVTADCTSDCACQCTAGPQTGRRFTGASCALSVVLNLLSENCY